LPERPDDLWTFEEDLVGHFRVSAVEIQEPAVWAARLDLEDQNVTRTWITEIGVWKQSHGEIGFACRLQCVAATPDTPVNYSIPNVIRTVCDLGVATLDDRPISAEPWFVDSPAAVQTLVRFLVSPKRTSQVIVFSLGEHSVDPSKTVIPLERLCNDLLGVAHVVILSGPAAFGLTSTVGRDHSVFNQAVRVYNPGFSPEHDDPSAHPLVRAPRVLDLNRGAERFIAILKRQAIARTVLRPDPDRELPSFASIRHAAARIARDTAIANNATESELLELALTDNRRLEEELQESRDLVDSLLQQADTERVALENELQAERSRGAHLRARINTLLAERSEAPTALIPDGLDELEAWSNVHLAGHIELLPRAFRGAGESAYAEPQFVYRALLLLRDYYVPMRRDGGTARKHAFEQACHELGLEESATLSNERYGEHGDTYVVRHGGTKRYLERHLKKGTSRDQRHCFRLYFFWEQSTEQVVVGWLTSHLDTRAS